ncbi:MAG: formamidopyrimidine-DNA glycosylase, partial [Myxococcales bacterium]|nr:formamidopyrimidine-DNA glycosylase [Myxococcales bacterium]
MVYVERLAARMVGGRITAIRLGSPFVVRTAEPPLSTASGREVVSVRRIGKRLVLGLEDELFLVVHLMIAGRLRWKRAGSSHRAKDVLVVFDVEREGAQGCLVFTEASPKKRASLHLVRGEAALRDFDRGGLDPFAIDVSAFAERLRLERHTVKRTLTDPTLFDGIG